MMRKRPKFLLYLALSLIGIVISFPLQISFIYGHSLFETAAITAKLSFLNWWVMFISIGTAYLLLQASHHLRWAVPLLMISMVLNNWFVGAVATDYSLVSTSLASAGFLVLMSSVFQSDVRGLMKDPNLRWWLRAERVRVAVPVFIGGLHHTPIRSRSFDISETGVFIPLRDEFAVDEALDICIKLGVYTQIRCEGRIVRRQQEASGIYPVGIGIQFETLASDQRRELKRYLARQQGELPW
jgi:hypothetical protein